MRRKIYDSLVTWSEKPYDVVPIVVGARQIGKTFIIREFIKETYDNVIELNFVTNSELCSIFDNSLDVDTLITEISVRIPNARFVPGKTILFFDEIQACPNARTSFKPFVEDGRFRVIASGSLQGIRRNAPRSNPVGFYDEVRMYPLDFEEFLWAIGMEPGIVTGIENNLTKRIPYSKTVLDSLERYFRIYMIVGGMPEVVTKYISTKDVNQVRSVQKILLNGYRDDIIKYADPNEKDRILACFDSIPVHLSKESKKFVFSEIESDLQPTYRTYESSVKWMEEAAIVNICNNLASPTEPIEEAKKESQFKMYMGDTGLLMYLLGSNVAKALLSGDTRVNRGAATENAVSQCLVSRGLKIHYFKNNSFEIDFITVMGPNVGAIEIKSGNNKQAKSLRYLKQKYKVARMMKFENSNIFTDDSGIEHYPLFACAFIDALFPDPVININLNVSELIKELDKDQ